MPAALRALLLFASAALSALAQTNAEVRFLCFAPSPYSHRHDAMRAGLGIHLSLKNVIAQHHLPLTTTFHDGSRAFDRAETALPLVRGAQVLVIGGATWAQGSSFHLRRFFELVDTEPLSGAAVSAWASAGGSHTGGDIVINDIFRSAMGMGAQVFSLGQKLMVFTTDERAGTPDGQFSSLDVWYMDQFARIIAVTALARGDRDRATALARQLGTSPQYWNLMPKDAKGLAPFEPLAARLNAAADEKSPAWQELLKLVK